jgi:hypothetical protein
MFTRFEPIQRVQQFNQKFIEFRIMPVRYLYCITFFISCLITAKSQDYNNSVLIPECSIKIDGFTNINSFSLTCLAKSNVIQIYPAVSIKGFQKVQDYKVNMILPVQCFETDNPGIKSDFIDLVQGNRYPDMDINITHFCLTESSKYETDSTTDVGISIGGVTRNYNIRFRTSNNSRYIIVTGHQKVNIRDFNLEPPIKFFGMIKVKEIIDINFKLLFKPSDKMLINKNILTFSY